MNEFEIAQKLFGSVLSTMVQSATGKTDTCILNTRIVLDVLKAIGVKAQPLPVEVMVYNEPLHKLLIEKHGYPDDEEFEQWKKSHPEIWSVGIGIRGVKQLPNKWNGHLIAVTDEVLIDTTLPQANRLEHDIILTPVTANVGKDAIWKFTHDAVDFAFNINKCRVVYKLNPLNIAYVRSPDWNAKQRRSEMVKTILKLIKSMKGASDVILLH